MLQRANVAATERARDSELLSLDQPVSWAFTNARCGRPHGPAGPVLRLRARRETFLTVIPDSPGTRHMEQSIANPAVYDAAEVHL
jgi:hypothetical protein